MSFNGASPDRLVLARSPFERNVRSASRSAAVRCPDRRVHSVKLALSGVIVSIQPRIRMTRSFDERSLDYLGYSLRFKGEVGENREFLVGISPDVQTEHQLRAGDTASGEWSPVADPRVETVEFYEASGITVVARAPDVAPPTPTPWRGVPPELSVYRARGGRRLDARTYTAKCRNCVWGCHMAVEMIVDHWNPSVRRHRTETFCYGPKNCRFYRAGRTRVVPGRRGMSYVEEDWVDADETAHRSPDE